MRFDYANLCITLIIILKKLIFIHANIMTQLVSKILTFHYLQATCLKLNQAKSYVLLSSVQRATEKFNVKIFRKS